MNRGLLLAGGTVFVSIFAFLIAGCGGDGGGDSTLEGTLAGAPADRSFTLDTVPPQVLVSVKICALDGCDWTNRSGEFNFDFSGNQFAGGPLLFTFLGKNISTTSTIPDLPPNPTFIKVHFIRELDGKINGFLDEVTAGPEPVPGPEPSIVPTFQPGPEPTDIPQFTPEPDVTATPEPTFAYVPGTPQPTPTIVTEGYCKNLASSYTGNSGCQIGSFAVQGFNAVNGFTLNPFGVNGPVDFAFTSISGAASISNNLTLFGKTGHSCELSCNVSASTISLSCHNPSGGSCTETFTATS